MSIISIMFVIVLIIIISSSSSSSVCIISSFISMLQGDQAQHPRHDDVRDGGTEHPHYTGRSLFS